MIGGTPTSTPLRLTLFSAVFLGTGNGNDDDDDDNDGCIIIQLMMMMIEVRLTNAGWPSLWHITIPSHSNNCLSINRPL